jgi:hypothetical protein
MKKREWEFSIIISPLELLGWIVVLAFILFA